MPVGDRSNLPHNRIGPRFQVTERYLQAVRPRLTSLAHVRPYTIFVKHLDLTEGCVVGVAHMQDDFRRRFGYNGVSPGIRLLKFSMRTCGMRTCHGESQRQRYGRDGQNRGFEVGAKAKQRQRSA